MYACTCVNMRVPVGEGMTLYGCLSVFRKKTAPPSLDEHAGT